MVENSGTIRWYGGSLTSWMSVRKRHVIVAILLLKRTVVISDESGKQIKSFSAIEITQERVLSFLYRKREISLCVRGHNSNAMSQRFVTRMALLTYSLFLHISTLWLWKHWFDLFGIKVSSWEWMPLHICSYHG